VIRTAEAGDGPAIAALEQEAFGSDAWSDALVSEGLAGQVPGALYLVAEDDASPAVVGYAAASLFADGAELQRIAVATGLRRTGIASALLTRVEAEARLRYSEQLLLEVRENNPAALAFYARRGFTEVDRRPRYSADGTTANVHARRLTDEEDEA
jgi:ribosomal protein S18 acetylase RimI-like enzyme